jgi:hypothetical protein
LLQGLLFLFLLLSIFFFSFETLKSYLAARKTTPALSAAGEKGARLPVIVVVFKYLVL